MTGAGSDDVNDMILTARYYTHQDIKVFCFENAGIMDDGQISVPDIPGIAEIFMDNQ